MIPARFAAHVRRRRGLWIAAGVLAVAIVPYVTAFYTLRTRTMASFMHVGPSGNRYSTTHRLYHFEGGPHVTPALYYAFIPLHQWCLGGMTAEEFGALSPEQMREGVRDVYLPAAFP